MDGDGGTVTLNFSFHIESKVCQGKLNIYFAHLSDLSVCLYLDQTMMGL